MPLPHLNCPLTTLQGPLLVVSVKPEPDGVMVNVAGVWTDHVPAVSTPPVTEPEDVSTPIVDLVGRVPDV